MNTINDSNQQARNFSAHLGTLAAANATAPTSLPPRLVSILQHFRNRRQAHEDVRHKVRATEFMMGA
jgi:hypothetical protein